MTQEPWSQTAARVICLATLAAAAHPRPASGEDCWFYQLTPAYTKLACPGEPLPATQTNQERHDKWHSCFGAFGEAAGPNFRGQRFIAFHRQIIQEFNVWREEHGGAAAGLPRIETWDANQGARIPLPYPACVSGYNRLCDKDGDDVCTGALDDIVLCDSCVDLPRCFTVNSDNTTPCPPFPYTNLDQFKNADEVGIAIDRPDGWHVTFHIGLSDADGDPTTPGVQGCADANSTFDTTGEPMFWQAHQKLDDVLTAWQVRNAVDVVMVLDRSGSMSDPAPGGGTKLDKAKEAAKLFASLVRGSTNGSENRIGVASFASTADERYALNPSTAAISADGTSGPLITAVDGITHGGATSIGSGLEQALCMLCPNQDGDGDCQSDDCEGAGGNARKAILLLTDGLENTPHCVDGATLPCQGQEIPYEGADPYKSLGYTQVCAVGYGDASALDGDLLTRLTERQGGIYIGAKDVDDLKDFFAKCYGEVTDALLGLDPKGVLEPEALVSEPSRYGSCQDSNVTFVLGWQEPVPQGSLRLEVTTPSGAAVNLASPAVRRDQATTWDFARVGLPHAGESSGQWTAHAVRPHRSYVNGFTSDAFEDKALGVAIVRRQIQRLCPEPCRQVLYYESPTASGASVYAEALQKEVAAGTIGSLARAAAAGDFAGRLPQGRYDLIVYANQKDVGAQPYDAALRRVLCDERQATIVSDNREASVTADLFKCLGAARDGLVNTVRIMGDGRLADGMTKLRDPGYAVFSYGLVPAGGSDPQAYFATEHGPKGHGTSATHAPRRHFARSAAVVATGFGRGPRVNWFVDILARGLSRLDPHVTASRLYTGDVLKPSVRIVEAFRPHGGYDTVVARVEVTRPSRGIGDALVAAGLGKADVQAGDPRDARQVTLAQTGWNPDGDHGHPDTRTFVLYDDGTHGDHLPNNHYWTVDLPSDFARVGGNYRYHFVLDLTKNGCTQRREASQTVFVETRADPRATRVSVRPADGQRNTVDVTLTPRDGFGNHVGPGRGGEFHCGPDPRCRCDARQTRDHGDGSYTLRLAAAEGVKTCTIEGLRGSFEVVPERDARQCADACQNVSATSYTPKR
jgi:hypothetical protein